MAATVSSSVRLSCPFEAALQHLGTNRAALLLGFLLVGVAELGEVSGLELTTMQGDLHHVLRYHLPEPLRRRLATVQATLRIEEQGGEAAPNASVSREGASAQPAPAPGHAAVMTPDQQGEPEDAGAVLDPLAGEGDDY